MEDRWEKCGRQGMGKVCGEGARSFQAGSEDTIVPESPYAHQPGSCPKPVLSGFCGGLITEVLLIK